MDVPLETFDDPDVPHDGHGYSYSDQDWAMAQKKARRTQAPAYALPDTDSGQGIPYEQVSELLAQYREHWADATNATLVHGCTVISEMERASFDSAAEMDERDCVILLQDDDGSVVVSFDEAFSETVMEAQGVTGIPATVSISARDPESIFVSDVPGELLPKVIEFFSYVTRRAVQITTEHPQSIRSTLPRLARRLIM